MFIRIHKIEFYTIYTYSYPNSIYNVKNWMNFDSPFKNNLIQFDHSANKAIVDCEINGWM
jgi:hypothetical protein